MVLDLTPYDIYTHTYLFIYVVSKHMIHVQRNDEQHLHTNKSL